MHLYAQELRQGAHATPTLTSAPLKTTFHLVLRNITEVRFRVEARARAQGKARAGVV